MKDDTTRGIEIAANVAIIFAAVLLGVVLIKNYILPNPGSIEGTTVQASDPSRRTTLPSRPRSDIQIQPGTRITLSGIDWANNGKTLVLAISNQCHFCSESAPFYQRLAKEHGKARLVAVLPQSVEQGKEYLTGLNVTVDEIRQAPLISIGVSGTPTLILVDKNGVATNSWVGKLTPAREDDVLGSLR
jgi:hypothetical protein